MQLSTGALSQEICHALLINVDMEINELVEISQQEN